MFFTVPVEEFERIKNRIPTSIPWTNGYGKYCVFVNFDGSVQKCHHCQQPGHIEKECPVKAKLNEGQLQLAIEEPAAETSLSATIMYQQPPTNKNKFGKIKKSKRPTHRSTPYKQKPTADSTIEDKREESSESETDESDEANETEYDADNVTAEMYIDYCFPGWKNIEKKTAHVWIDNKMRHSWRDDDVEKLVPVPQFAIPKSARKQEFKKLPMRVVADVINTIHDCCDQICHHPEFEGFKPLCFDHRRDRYQNGRKLPSYSQTDRLHADPKYKPDLRDSYLSVKY